MIDWNLTGELICLYNLKKEGALFWQDNLKSGFCFIFFMYFCTLGVVWVGVQRSSGKAPLLKCRKTINSDVLEQPRAALLSSILPSTYLRKWVHKSFQNCVWPSGGHCTGPTDFLHKTGRGQQGRREEIPMRTEKHKTAHSLDPQAEGEQNFSFVSLAKEAFLWIQTSCGPSNTHEMAFLWVGRNE